jgi:DNA polymerase-3 subunit delta
VITTIEAAYGPEAKLDADAVAPFLGEAGGVPPWDLTDAIDSGNIGLAIERVHRMLGAGSMHSLQVLAILTTHSAGSCLEGADVQRGDAAALGLKGKSTFPAKKAVVGQPPRLRRQRPSCRPPGPGRRRSAR